MSWKEDQKVCGEQALAVRTELQKADADFLDLERKRRDLQGQLRNLEIINDSLRQIHILETPLDPAVRLVRDQLLAYYAEADRDTIIVARQRELREKLIPAAIAQLQALCPHPFVFHLSGYGRYGDDEDYFAGLRRCRVCNLAEDEKKNDRSPDPYQVLTRHDSRLIVNVANRNEIMDESWPPLDQLYKRFRKDTNWAFKTVEQWKESQKKPRE